MSSIRSKDTKPEALLRKSLWSMGIRGYKKHADMPGKPDILFTRYKLAVFVDGCFWHGCPKHYRPPQSNTGYWWPKIRRNQERDKENEQSLRSDGYKVLRIWEHEVAEDPAAAARLVRQHLESLGMARS